MQIGDFARKHKFERICFFKRILKLGARFECLQMQISFAFSLLFVRGFRDICHLQRNSALM